MGGSLSTIRWTPYGPMPIGHDDRQGRGQGRKLHKSKSYPPPPGSNNYGSSQSPSSSTTNLTYENDTDDDEFTGDSGHGGHLGTSGILMGTNAPPLYDACLVGRWDEVLEICGVSSSNTNEDGEGSNGDGSGEGMSSASPAQTATTHCSSSSGLAGVDVVGGGISSSSEGGETGGEEGFPSEGRSSPSRSQMYGGNGSNNVNSSTHSTNHPCLQTRYVDRRRNTPLHLACRRQPPPSVIRALLNHSPCEAVSRRTADGLTPLHFAAYCGADVEVVSMLVDRMRSDAAVSRAARLSLALTLDENDELNEEDDDDGDDQKGDNNKNGRRRLPSDEVLLPPTRLFDRRQRTPLHCALSGFRTPIRPLIVRKLLAVDPASSTLPDERGRTPLSLLFDDYAEEIMEALEDDVSVVGVREQIAKGGELYECWKMLRVLLEGAYVGSVCEDEDDEHDDGRGEKKRGKLPTHLGGHEGTISETADIATPPPSAAASPPPQDRLSRPNNVGEVPNDHEHFSMIHAAAGVWECPAPLAKLVLKCLCSNGTNVSSGWNSTDDDSSQKYFGVDDLDHNVEPTERSFLSGQFHEAASLSTTSRVGGGEKDLIRQREKETMRLPLHIAVCAQPQCPSSARLKVWGSSSSTHESSSSRSMARQPSQGSLASGITTTTLATHPDRRGRSSAASSAKGQVYNPRFGRSPSRDSVVAYSSSQRRITNNNGPMSSAASTAGSIMSRSGSNSSITANIAREPFLQHTMVRDILELYPEAASVVDESTGKLPIVLAIEHGKSWEMAVGPLIDAYPTPFGGGGDGGMALPDHSEEGKAHRAALQNALFTALSSPELFVREESIRTAGKLVNWGGVYGMMGSLDGIVCEWLDMMISSTPSPSSSSSSPEGIIVGPGAAASETDWIQTQSSHLTAVAEVVSNARADSISDRVARLCLDTSREYLFSKDGTVREAAARVLGNTLNSVGDADDAANVMREVVLHLSSDDGSVVSSASTIRRKEDNVISKHGRLLACNSILSTQWGCELMAAEDICNAILSFIHRCVKDRNTVVRSAAYNAIGPILGKSNIPSDADKISPSLVTILSTTVTLKELRSDILKGTRASENVDVQLALARGLTSASRIHPNLFLCKPGMPIMDAALMLAMPTNSSARSLNVQKAFQIFLWVALQMGHQANDDAGSIDGASHSGDPMSPGLEKYIELAEGENGRIMMKFVTQTLAKIEDLDDQLC